MPTFTRKNLQLLKILNIFDKNHSQSCSETCYQNILFFNLITLLNRVKFIEIYFISRKAHGSEIIQQDTILQIIFFFDLVSVHSRPVLYIVKCVYFVVKNGPCQGKTIIGWVVLFNLVFRKKILQNLIKRRIFLGFIDLSIDNAIVIRSFPGKGDQIKSRVGSTYIRD